MNKKITAMTIVLALAGMAQAATVTYSSGTAISSSQSSSTATISASTLGVQQFDSSLGTLTGVTLTVNVIETTRVLVENTSSGTADITVTFDTGANYIKLTANGGYSSEKQGITFSSTDESQTLAAGETLDTGVHNSNAQTASVTINNSSDLAAFIGNSTVSGVSLVIYNPTSVDTTGDKYSASTTRGASTTWTVTYTYTPSEVPEPVSMALFGVGGLVIGLRRRFGKHKKA